MRAGRGDGRWPRHVVDGAAASVSAVQVDICVAARRVLRGGRRGAAGVLFDGVGEAGEARLHARVHASVVPPRPGKRPKFRRLCRR
jgi:hypothetical protein